MYFCLILDKHGAYNKRIGGYKSLLRAVNAGIKLGTAIIINESRTPVAVVQNHRRVK